MAPTVPCPHSHSALVHSSRQTDGGPSSCTSFLSTRTSLLKYLHSLTRRSLSFSPPPSIYLSHFLFLSDRQERAIVLFLPFLSLYLTLSTASYPLYTCTPALCLPLSLSLSLSPLWCLCPFLSPPSVRTLSLSSSLFTTTLPAPASAARAYRNYTPSLSTEHRYITQQRHHTRSRKNEPRMDY